MSLRVLVTLFVVVLAAHAVFLTGVPGRILVPAQSPMPAWTARTLVLAPPEKLSSPRSGAVAQVAASTVRPSTIRPVRPNPELDRAQAPPVAADLNTAPTLDIAEPAAPGHAAWVVPVDAAAASAHAAVLARAAAQKAPVDVPGSISLRYEVTAFTRQLHWRGQGQLQWRHDGSEYEARLDISALLLPTRTQVSTGRVTPEGLAPLRFSDKARSEEATHFRREQGRISFSSNKPDAPLTPGAQDRLSVLLQLGALIAAEPGQFPGGTTIAIQTAGTREAEIWLFSVNGPEELDLPGGHLHTVKLTRMPRKEFDVKVEVWLAPGMDYVPVRLRLTQPNGDWADQQWSSTDRG